MQVSELVVLQQDNQPAWTDRASLGQDETMLELAVKGGSDPWTIAQINGLTSPSASLPGDILYLPSGSSTAPPSGLPAAIVSAVKWILCHSGRDRPHRSKLSLHKR